MADRVGRAAGWVPVVAGLVLLSWVALAVGLAGSGPAAVVAGLLPAILALRICWMGYRTARDGNSETARIVTGWIASGAAVMALVVGWFWLLVERLGVTPGPALAGATVVGAGALLGLRIGRASARARREEREATRERLARRYAERRRERVTLLNRILRHNVRNGLSVVVAHVDALDPHVDDEGAEHLAGIRERSAAMGDTVDTFQRVAETLAGTRDLEPRDLGTVLPAAVERARGRYPDASFALDAPGELRVTADDLLDRVLDAQLENAVEHHDGDPSVTVTCERRADRAVVRVADDGPGIPDREKDLLFEAGDRGVTTEGDGLDLFLVAAVLERYGGSITVEDNDPRGTVFVSELPLAASDGRPASSGADRASAPGGDRPAGPRSPLDG